MKTEMTNFPFDESYRDEVFKRYYKGGLLYFIERTDTNQILYEPLDFDIKNQYSKSQAWTKTITHYTLWNAYLNKEDAEKHRPIIKEGGCRCCGNGSILIETIITEHEFINQ